MISSNLYEKTENRVVSMEAGAFRVVEYIKDMSVDHTTAQTEFFAAEMNVHKRQLAVELSQTTDCKGVVVQAGAMQLMIGDVTASSDIKGAMDLAKKFMGSAVTSESAIKPKYSGMGTLVLEPTYKHLIIQDLAEWGGSMVIQDGAFLACEAVTDMKVVSRKNISSAALGGEGLFNLCLHGRGKVVLESRVPVQEIIVFDLQNDILKIDGNMAIAWSDSLDFTVEKTTKSLIGSAATGEGFVNVYRGTGRIMMVPV